MSNIQEIDIKALHNNLKDLDYLSKKLLDDMVDKNRILESGLNDCATCRASINGTNNNRKTSYRTNGRN